MPKLQAPNMARRFGIGAYLGMGFWVLGFSALALLSAGAEKLRLVSPAPRVASLAPSLSELVYALGAESNLVARSSACDYPPAVRALPVVGDFGRPNLEYLQALRPDLILATDLENPALSPLLESLHIRVLVLPCEGWTSLLAAARALGRELGIAERAEQWIADLTRRRADLTGRVDAFWLQRPRPRVYFEVWGDPLTTPGGTSFVDDLIEWAGGHNVAHQLPENYAHVSSEWVVREQPDVTVLAYMVSSAPGGAGGLASRPGWKNLRAAQADSICASIPSDLLLRPGPRMVEGAEQLAAWLMRWEERSGDHRGGSNH